MPSERKLNVSLSMKIKGESTSVKVLPWGVPDNSARGQLGPRQVGPLVSTSRP